MVIFNELILEPIFCPDGNTDPALTRRDGDFGLTRDVIIRATGNQLVVTYNAIKFHPHINGSWIFVEIDHQTADFRAQV